MSNVLKNVNAALEEIKATDISGNEDNSSSERAAITLWFGPEYKNKYEHYQRLTNKKFGKLIQKLVKTAIDSVES